MAVYLDFFLVGQLFIPLAEVFGLFAFNKYYWSKKVFYKFLLVKIEPIKYQLVTAGKVFFIGRTNTFLTDCTLFFDRLFIWSTVAILPFNMNNQRKNHIGPKSSQLIKQKYDEKFPYCHAEKVHTSFQFSPLSTEYSGLPSFRGFIHLAVLLLVVNTVRSVFENYLKYGNLMSMPFTEISVDDWTYSMASFV